MKNIYYKNAFTMLELVFVVVVLGIVATIAMPNLDRDRTQEAADSILADIRYTQHMAMVDFRQQSIGPNATQWQRSFWQIRIESCGGNSGLFLGIGADTDYGGDINRAESAIDPSNGKEMFWLNTSSCAPGVDLSAASENIFLTKKFGVSTITATGCAQHIGFDHLGRPHAGFSNSGTPDYSSYLQNNCRWTFTVEGGDNFSIDIFPETGYAQIVGQPSS